MSIIDLSKLKNSLENSGISVIDYYVLDGKCSMIKAYIYSIQQFLFIYIPTKLRSEIKNKRKIYELKLLDEVLDEEDYAKFDEYQIDMVLQKSDKDSYKNFSQKYNKQITINGDGVEKFEKRITRQIKRINIPFSKLDYTIGIQNKKIMALHFGEEINLFYIKNFTKDVRCYMYIVNVKELIDNITEMQYEIGNINNQFFTIICDIIDTNLKEISILNKTNYETIIEKFKKQRFEYQKKTDKFSSYIKNLDEEEKNEIKKYKNLFTKETSNIRRNVLENEYQTLINSFSKKRNDQIDVMIEDTYIFHIIFLLLEEISFDNFVMLKRTTSNFEKLTALF
jgi:hypothetical protein